LLPDSGTVAGSRTATTGRESDLPTVTPHRPHVNWQRILAIIEAELAPVSLVLKATANNQQISQFCPQIQRTEVSYRIYAIQ